MKKRIIVGATGASGLPILVQCLKLIREQDEFESYLIMTDNAKLTFEHETGQPVREVEALADDVLDASEIGAGPASGSFRTDMLPERRGQEHIWYGWISFGQYRR